MSAASGWRGYRALDALAVVCGAIAVVILILPASTSVAPDRLRITSPDGEAARASRGTAFATSVATSVATDSLARAIVRTNAFSASRKEPTERFVAPGSEPAPTASVFEPTGGAPAAYDVETGPQLFGIVSVGGTPRALLQLRAEAEPPRLLGVGESFGGVRVVRIAGDRVVISSSNGTRTLRLSRVVPDSSENVP